MEPKGFEFKINGNSYVAEIGKCACVLFYQNPEVDYLAIDLSEPGDEETSTLRVFENVMLVRWMAGLAISPEGFQNITLELDGEDKRFREVYGFNPATIIKERPSADEEEYWLDVQTRSMEQEWSNWEGDSGEHPDE